MWAQAQFKNAKIEIKTEKPTLAFIKITHSDEKGNFNVGVFKEKLQDLLNLKQEINSGKQFDIVCNITNYKNKAKNPTTGNWDVEYWTPSFILESIKISDKQVKVATLDMDAPTPNQVEKSLESFNKPALTEQEIEAQKPKPMAKQEQGIDYDDIPWEI